MPDITLPDGKKIQYSNTIDGFETETSTRLGEHVSNRQKVGRQIRRKTK